MFGSGFSAGQFGRPAVHAGLGGVHARSKHVVLRSGGLRLGPGAVPTAPTRSQNAGSGGARAAAPGAAGSASATDADPPLESMKLADLQAALAALGLPRSGRKAELAARLAAARAGAAAAAAATPAPAPAAVSAVAHAAAAEPKAAARKPRRAAAASPPPPPSEEAEEAGQQHGVEAAERPRRRRVTSDGAGSDGEGGAGGEAGGSSGTGAGAGPGTAARTRTRRASGGAAGTGAAGAAAVKAKADAVKVYDRTADASAIDVDDTLEGLFGSLERSVSVRAVPPPRQAGAAAAAAAAAPAAVTLASAASTRGATRRRGAAEEALPEEAEEVGGSGGDSGDESEVEREPAGPAAARRRTTEGGVSGRGVTAAAAAADEPGPGEGLGWAARRRARAASSSPSTPDASAPAAPAAAPAVEADETEAGAAGAGAGEPEPEPQGWAARRRARAASPDGAPAASTRFGTPSATSSSAFASASSSSPSSYAPFGASRFAAPVPAAAAGSPSGSRSGDESGGEEAGPEVGERPRGRRERPPREPPTGPPPDLTNLPPWPEMFMGCVRRPEDMAPGNPEEQLAILQGNVTGLTLTSLGSAAARPNAGVALGCTAVARSKDTFILDAGDDTQRRLAAADVVRPSKVFRILLTSLSPECVLGLPGLLCVINASRERGHELADVPVHVYGPIGTADFLATMMRVSQTMLDITIVVHEFSPEAATEEESEPSLFAPRAKIWRCRLPPDQLNPRGGLDGSLLLFAPDQGRSNRRSKRGRGAGGGGILAQDPRAGYLPFPPLEPGDPSRTGLDPLSLTWTLELDIAGRCIVTLLPGAEGAPYSLSYTIQEADRAGGLVMERAQAAGLAGGVQYSKLKAGETVPNLWGEPIAPELVISPQRPGRRVVLMGTTPRPGALAAHAHTRGADVLVAGGVWAQAEAAEAGAVGGCTTAALGEAAARMGVRYAVLSRFDGSRLDPYAEDEEAEARSGSGSGSGSGIGRTTARPADAYLDQLVAEVAAAAAKATVGRGGGGGGGVLRGVFAVRELQSVVVEKNEGGLEPQMH